MDRNFYYRLTAFTALICAAGVMMGAFAAHALKSRISPEQLDVIKTGVLYLFIHALAILFICGMAIYGSPARLLKFSGVIFVVGIFLFSGSLFLLSTREVTGLDIAAIGFVTPIGGLCFITGWVTLCLWGFKAGRG